jgi:hypothetical protein
LYLLNKYIRLGPDEALAPPARMVEMAAE